MNVLVTGGSGYFGEVLLSKLLKKGFNCKNFDLNNLDNECLSSNVETIIGDIRDRDSLSNALKGIDIVFHNVAQVPVAKDNNLFFEVNYTGTENLLDLMVRNNVSKIVYTSSSAIFGVPSENPVLENTIPKPFEAYGKAKLYGENSCLRYLKQNLIDVSIIRPRTILGHGRLGIFQILFEWVINGYNLPVFDGGKNVYQFCHADDLADACILSSELDVNGIYNIGAEEYGTMRQLLQGLIDHAGGKQKITSLNSNLIKPFMTISSITNLSPLGAYHAKMYGSSMFFDLKKAKNDLGWVSNFSNQEMIKESFDWYVSNRNDVLSNSKKRSHHKSLVKQGILSLIGKLL